MLNTTALAWHKSSRSGAGNNCVEVAIVDREHVAIRDSKAPDGGVLVVGRTGMATWLTGIKAGRLAR